MSYKSFFEGRATGLHWLKGYSTEGNGPPESVAPRPFVAPTGCPVARVACVARSPDPYSCLTDEAAAFEERAAICEHDGGLPASHAELVALACVAPLGTGETPESRDATIISLAEHFDRLRAARKPGQ